jgi:hopanoid biosynthesis associated protein HpnK
VAGRSSRGEHACLEGALKRLILTADDFGIAAEVNEAVELAHRNGVLRSASLMVGAPATQDAVARARALPSLAVGLHVVLVNGRPVLEPQRVPDLVDRDGNFLTELVRAGVRFFFRPGVRKQLVAEIRAQFERFAQTGLALDHANAQSHMHVHPTLFALILRIGREYGLRAIRIPCEPFGRTRSIAPWLALMRARARRAGVVYNDYAFGVTEIFFHPALRAFSGADAGTESYQWSGELAALTSAGVRSAIERLGIARITYGELAPC